MFKFLNARYRHITGRHNIPYASLPVTWRQLAESGFRLIADDNNLADVGGITLCKGR